jgi:hypothetical protein
MYMHLMRHSYLAGGEHRSCQSQYSVCSTAYACSTLCLQYVLVQHNGGTLVAPTLSVGLSGPVGDVVLHADDLEPGGHLVLLDGTQE